MFLVQLIHLYIHGLSFEFEFASTPLPVCVCVCPRHHVVVCVCVCIPATTWLCVCVCVCVCVCIPATTWLWELYQEVCKPVVDFEKVESIVSKDVAVSYQLIKFVNAMSDRLEVSISSFRQALVYLGQDKLKTFVSLAIASYISSTKPRALFDLSLQRAQFCLLMARDNPFREFHDQAFLIGLFSILDALLDLSLEQLVGQLPLTETIKSALLAREGPSKGKKKKKIVMLNPLEPLHSSSLLTIRSLHLVYICGVKPS